MDTPGDTPRHATHHVGILRRIWKNTDNLTKWIQVAALVFAASWTYLTFRETQAPSLETPASVSAEINGNWRPEPAPGSCNMFAIFRVQDLGVKSFDVASSRVRLWRKPLPAQDRFLFLDIPKFENESQPVDDIKSTVTLVGHYAPKTDLHATFNWIFYGQPSNDLFFAKIELLDKSGNPVGNAFAWDDQVCFRHSPRT
jgi:hypothetical protein